MSLTVDNRRFFCTTSDTAFGPQFESDDEGERFRSWMYKNHGDPRQYQPLVLTAYYADWIRSESAAPAQPAPPSEFPCRLCSYIAPTGYALSLHYDQTHYAKQAAPSPVLTRCPTCQSLNKSDRGCIAPDCGMNQSHRKCIDCVDPWHDVLTPSAEENSDHIQYRKDRAEKAEAEQTVLPDEIKDWLWENLSAMHPATTTWYVASDGTIVSWERLSQNLAERLQDFLARSSSPAVAPTNRDEEKDAGFYAYAMEVKMALTEEFGETFPGDHPKLDALMEMTETIINVERANCAAPAVAAVTPKIIADWLNKEAQIYEMPGKLAIAAGIRMCARGILAEFKESAPAVAGRSTNWEENAEIADLKLENARLREAVAGRTQGDERIAQLEGELEDAKRTIEMGEKTLAALRESAREAPSEYHYNAMKAVLAQILIDLPSKKDWLDPAIERVARSFAFGPSEASSKAPSHIECEGCGRSGPLSYVGRTYTPKTSPEAPAAKEACSIDLIVEMEALLDTHCENGGCDQEDCGCPGSRLRVLVNELRNEFGDLTAPAVTKEK